MNYYDNIYKHIYRITRYIIYKYYNEMSYISNLPLKLSIYNINIK